MPFVGLRQAFLPVQVMVDTVFNNCLAIKLPHTQRGHFIGRMFKPKRLADNTPANYEVVSWSDHGLLRPVQFVVIDPSTNKQTNVEILIETVGSNIAVATISRLASQALGLVYSKQDFTNLQQQMQNLHEEIQKLRQEIQELKKQQGVSPVGFNGDDFDIDLNADCQ